MAKPIALQIESRVRMQVSVRDNNFDQALRVLKKKLQREGVYRKMKLRRHFDKPSENEPVNTPQRSAGRAKPIASARKRISKR